MELRQAWEAINKAAKPHYVYALASKQTNRMFYVGIGRGRRISQHEACVRNGQGSSYRAAQEIARMRASGDDVRYALLSFHETSWQAGQAERGWIKAVGRRDLGLGWLVNATDGGDGGTGLVITDEMRARMAEAANGRSLDGP